MVDPSSILACPSFVVTGTAAPATAPAPISAPRLSLPMIPADQRTGSSPQPDLGGSLTPAVTSLTPHLRLHDRRPDRTGLATYFKRFEAQLEHRRFIRTLAFLCNSHDSIGRGARMDQDIALRGHYVTDERCVEPVTRSIGVRGERLRQPEGHAGSGGNNHDIQRGRNSILGAGGVFAPQHNLVVAR